MIMKQRRELPMAFALARSSAGSPVRAAVPCSLRGQDHGSELCLFLGIYCK